MGCENNGCSVKIAAYNYPNTKPGRFCAKHQLPGMVNVNTTTCEFVANDGQRCQKHPSYNFPGKKGRKRCKNHSLPGMVDNATKKCDFINIDGTRCSVCSTFNFPKEKSTRRCKAHIIEGMINMKDAKCNFAEDGRKCDTTASFNFPNEKKPTRCYKHKLDEMINISINKCQVDNCSSTARFNFENERGGKTCKKHCLKGMVDVVNKKCEALGCMTRPSFNFDGLKAAFCKEHILPSMVDVTHKRCNFENCKIRSNFGFPKSFPERCEEHKTIGMISLSGKKCEKCGIITACYNLPSEKIPRFCKAHKLSNMICVVDKKCEECGSRANYGKLFEKKNHCAKHKLANDFHDNQPICSEEACIENAFYTNDETNYPRRCEIHKLENDINIVEKECSNCKLFCYLNQKSGLCGDCNNFIIEKVNKIQETTVLKFLKENGTIFETEDKIPQNGCSKFRPDGVIDFLYFKVILEIDENQHKSYSNKCEMTRMIQLQQDYGGIPIIFIRYNPDNYKDINRNIIKPNPKRLHLLYDVLRSLGILKNEYEKNNTQLPPLSMIYMFYNNFDGTAKLETIDILKEIVSD